MYNERLCLVLGREMVCCEGGAGVFWPTTPEIVKLEVGSVGRKARAHISGANDILSVREFATVGTARWDWSQSESAWRGSPAAATISAAACLDKSY